MCTGVISFWYRFVRLFSSFTARGNITYDRKRLAKRKNEPADAHHRNVGGQERDGCKEVKERGVRPEALQSNVQSTTRSAKDTSQRGGGGFIINSIIANNARYILRPTKDSGDLTVIFRGKESVSCDK